MLSRSDGNLGLIQRLQHGLIVSCQAPVDSPMHDPVVIAAVAQAAMNQGAVGVRIDTPTHVQAVHDRSGAPIIGLWKQQVPGFDVYITPQFCHAQAIAQAGADAIAIDATQRDRPNGETVESLIARIHNELDKPVMADVDTLEAAIAAAEAGADLVGTTLYGYTAATQHQMPPGFDLLTQLVQQLNTPVICEGGITSARTARHALALGAYAIVVGTAITGIDLQVKAYCSALTETPTGVVLETIDRFRLTRFDIANPTYRRLIDTELRNYALDYPEATAFFTPPKSEYVPLDLFLLDDEQNVCAGAVGSTHWHWLHLDLLWVDPVLRQQGYGRRLMMLIEQEAVKRGCTFARLSTLSFQARGFYEKLGYEVAGQLDDYPPGHVCFFMKKTLS